MDDNFEEMYVRVRSLYNEFTAREDISPMQVFGVFLGVIAQEFRDHSTQENFKEFLDTMKNQDWPKELTQ